MIVTVRNKERSTHIKDLQQLRGGNLHIIEADVVDQPAMQVTCISLLRSGLALMQKSNLQLAADEAAKISGGSLDVLVHNAARMEKENMPKGFFD